jgi:formylglycine-generating enzyme required for sulfatase activity
MQLIPGGDYEMGDHLGTGFYDELPVHAVYIDAFYMDTFEVTNEKYCAFLNGVYIQGLIEVINGVVYKKNDTEPYCETHPWYQDSRIQWNGSSFSVTPGKEDHPMLTVSWYGAVAYANWRSVEEGLTPCYDLETWECTFGVGGYRLPTEAEWEKASRGGEHNPYYDYPWGDTIDGSKANYWNSGDPYEVGNWPYSTPVGYYDGNQTPPGADMANGYGLYDMSGNVWEWCNDWYDHYYYQYCVDHGIYANPKGPSTGPWDTRVIRSGSWGYYDYSLRCAYRNKHYDPSTLSHDVGFRVVQD